ncbi:uncharacterized protein LOC144004267 isoform X2 [Festucalex cinctus]
MTNMQMKRATRPPHLLQRLPNAGGKSERGDWQEVRSSFIPEGLGVEPLLLRIERSQLRWLRHLVPVPPGRLPGEVFRACPTGGRLRGRPRTRWRDDVSRLALGSRRRSWLEWLGRGKSGLSLLKLLPPRPDLG